MLRYSDIRDLNHHSGVVLIIVLVFLQILTLLGLYSLKMAMIEMKESQQQTAKEFLDNASKMILSIIENQFIQSQPACVVSAMNTALLLNQPLTWWQGPRTCAGNFKTYQYYYVVESLGEDVCAFIEMIPKKMIAHYYRITLLNQAERVKTIWQSTVIIGREEPPFSQCKGVMHPVSMGRQMLREMNVLYAL